MITYIISKMYDNSFLAPLRNENSLLPDLLCEENGFYTVVLCILYT